VIIFIFVAFFSAFDFWTVKNVTGRLLVGLRWWTTIDENGNEKWYFESYNENVQMSAIDSKVFWTIQTGVTVFWSLFLFIKLISLSFFWGTLCFLAFFLSGLNLYGFYKCSKGNFRTYKIFVKKL